MTQIRINTLTIPTRSPKEAVIRIDKTGIKFSRATARIMDIKADEKYELVIEDGRIFIKLDPTSGFKVAWYNEWRIGSLKLLPFLCAALHIKNKGESLFYHLGEFKEGRYELLPVK